MKRITRLQFANRLGVTTTTIDKWIKRKKIPGPVNYEGSPKFDKKEIEKFINDKLKENGN